MSIPRFISRRSRPRRLRAESLEPRIVLAADALPWGGDAHLTLSFAPDGTNIAGIESNLFASFNALAPTESWQAEILRAFQTWIVETNAAVGLVADGGQPFGAPGAARGDERFGDIRIGAAPLASGTYALAIPADNVLSGTWVGDVIFNSEAGLSTIADVFAVALHESGHVLGLEHSLDPLSPMHVHGITPVMHLTPEDVAALQSLHGQPFPDQNELDGANNTLPDATHLDLNHAGMLPEGTAPSVVYGKVSSPSDVDFFRIETPGGYSGALSFHLRTAGISLLMPRLRLLDADGNLLAEVEATQIGGDRLTLTLPSVTPDRRYYAVVDSGRTDAFATGDYSLVATLEDLNVVSQSVIDQAADGSFRFLPQDEIAKLFGADDDDDVRFNDDFHTDDDAESGLALTPKPGFAPGMRYETIGSVVDSTDVDFYVIESPQVGGSVMTIRIRSLEAAGLMPRLEAYGDGGAALAVRVLANGGGELVAQIAGLPDESEVRLGIGAVDPNGPFNVGNYQMTIGFGADELALETVDEGTLTPAVPWQNQTLFIALPQLFHFALNVAPNAGDNGAAVVLRIYDSLQQVVYQVAARPGETRSAASVLLKPGEYRIEFTGLSASGPLDREINYTLFARPSSDPFVGDPDDPTFQPVYECPDLPGFFCYPGEFISPNPFLWDDFLASLPEPPQLSPAQTVGMLLGGWWTWVWDQMGVNGPPLAQDDKVAQLLESPGGAAAAMLPLNVLNNDLDPEGDAFVAVLQSTASHGTLTLLPDGTVDYTPDAGFAGVDTFTYTAYDFVGESRVATVRISVGLRGDAEGDSDVDGADFLTWQRNLGVTVTPSGSGSDFDGNGVVDGPDLQAWRDNFGMSTPASVPQAPAMAAAVMAPALSDARIPQTANPDLRSLVPPLLRPVVARRSPSAAAHKHAQREWMKLVPSAPPNGADHWPRVVDRVFTLWLSDRVNTRAAQDAEFPIRPFAKAVL
jgi:hypothetical protein